MHVTAVAAMLNDFPSPESLLHKQLYNFRAGLSVQILAVQNLIHGFAHDFLGAPTVDMLCRAVPTLNVEVQVSSDHRIGHGLLQAGIEVELTFDPLTLRNVPDSADQAGIAAVLLFKRGQS